LIYETIDKALQDSTDNILGKVMSALSGRINPEEARKIIIDRLLI
jgi:Asp-tRNA(Asn)/Glu-tRNA(Gln) amidotransferase B subunit